MLEPQLPTNEAARIAALHALDLLDTDAEERFDRITRTALQLFDVPIALISLVDTNRQWFKSCQGLSISETPRSISFCGHAILQAEALVIPDTLSDPRFVDNPLVTADPYIRFYAGQPLCAPDGSRVGTLCLMDRRPRDLSASALRSLRDLAFWAERELHALQLVEAQRLLQQTETRMRSLIAALSEGIVLQDREGAIQACNASAERVLGLSAEQMMGRTPIDPRWRAIHEDGTPFPGDQHPAMVTLRTGEPCIDVLMGVHKPNGQLCWLLVNSQPMFLDGQGQPSAVVCSFADITERKQTEAALRSAEQRFRTLVEQLPAITYVAELDEDSSTLYTSPQIETMLGFSQDEWMADHSLWRKQIHPDDYERVMDDMQLAQATGTPLPSEYRMLTRDGQAIWFRDQSLVVRDAAGQPLYLQGIMFDITERKHAEAALCASESRNRALLDAIPDMMFRINREGVYLDMRADDTSDLATAPTMIVGRTVFDILPADVAQRVLTCIEQALATGTVRVIEYQLMLDQMVRDFEARVVVCAPNEVLAIVRDITERKNMERMKNEFVSTVSHELRTPLTSIRGSLGLIAGGVAGDVPAKARSMVDIAYKNSERLIRLINDILDIEKIESGKMIFCFQPVELAPLLQSTIEANRAYGQQFDVAFDLEITAADAWIYADSDRLVQALTNLLSNAAKFSPPGSRVLVTLARHGDLIRIAIRDRGQGIPDTFRARLFQKFAQADASDARQKGGTGLGLSITKAIVDKLGGRIELATELDVGSTFSIDLPEWNFRQLSSSTPSARILICEPDRDAAELLATMLRASGCAADVALAPDEAKQRLATGDFSALVLDLAMVGQECPALIRELREQEATCHLPIVLVSTRSEPNSQHRHSTTPALSQPLLRPLEVDRLHEVLTRIERPAQTRAQILHVEDESDVQRVVAALLGEIADVTPAASVDEARRRLELERFDLVILDVELPDGSGLALLNSMSGTAGVPAPVIIFAAREPSQLARSNVAATLMKSQTSNQQLLETVTALIKRPWSHDQRGA